MPGTTPGNRPASIGIEHVRPDVDCGRYAVKRVVNDEVVVDADVFAHGHTEVAVRLEYRHERKRTWKPVPMEHLVNDRWIGRFPVDELGTYRFRIVAWVDELATWGRDFDKLLDAGVATDLDREEGARIAEQCAKRASNRDRTTLEAGAARLRAGSSERTLADVAKLVEVARRAVDLEAAAVFDATSPVWVDRPLARCSAWYEMFPRSASPDPARPGTLADVTIRLPYVASMGFDVLYLPPIHPIGTTNRKGRNNAVPRATERPRKPVGDRRRDGRAHGNRTRARNARRPCRAGRRRARLWHRSGARSRVPGITRPPMGARTSPMVPAPARRIYRVCRKPAETLRRHLPDRLRHRGSRRPVAGAPRRRPVLDRARDPGVPCRQPSHQALRLLGVADRSHPHAAIRRRSSSPRRSRAHE